jgi:hypothetical protein
MSDVLPIPETKIWLVDVAPGERRSPISTAIIRLSQRSARLMLFSQVGSSSTLPILDLRLLRKLTPLSTMKMSRQFSLLGSLITQSGIHARQPT